VEAISFPPSFPPSLPPPHAYLHVQKFTPGAGFADIMVEVEADATACGHVAGHALVASGLNSEGERGRREEESPPRG
jgi:hypothetical protein